MGLVTVNIKLPYNWRLMDPEIELAVSCWKSAGNFGPKVVTSVVQLVSVSLDHCSLSSTWPVMATLDFAHTTYLDTAWNVTTLVSTSNLQMKCKHAADLGSEPVEWRSCEGRRSWTRDRCYCLNCTASLTRDFVDDAGSRDYLCLQSWLDAALVSGFEVPRRLKSMGWKYGACLELGCGLCLRSLTLRWVRLRCCWRRKRRRLMEMGSQMSAVAGHDG